MKREGLARPSRNGPVLQYPGPVSSVYERPKERVEFHPERDSNPFFHLMESLWMLGGRNDVEFVRQFNSNISSYSDDGKTFHGAYGHRWKHWFGIDQVRSIIGTLHDNPNDRRQVLQMWDAKSDLRREGKDVPCNLMAVFGVGLDGRLDMIVYNRSNDAVWGCYGANAVHFSFLQEYIASSLGRDVGTYTQVSFNFHLYVENHQSLMDTLADKAVDPPNLPGCPYSLGQVRPFPLMSVSRDQWDGDLQMFLEHGLQASGYKDRFFRKVVVPMMAAWEVYKNYEGIDRYSEAQRHLCDVQALDWQLACVKWITRRYEKWQSKRTSSAQ